ncbi:hypothetical protein BA894_04335 [Vibrio natriegens]|uniref:hypothetical protein n=1 Tax=Vibrio natriegens TaxID=691 RepID=UPI000803F4F3|nr:hypothetical protein [Vibrio natriegens]ANQ25716.1 hypothetical protein BA894_04335 [Vibrio natriegens]
MILDCSYYEAVKRSLCEAFHTTEEDLISVLKSVKNDKQIDYYTLEKNVENTAREKLGEPDNELEILWFHGTRVEDHKSFSEYGILTKSLVKEELVRRLSSLASGLEKSGSNPFSLSMSGKNGDHDEGPFSFLIKTVAIQAPGANHNYTAAPELVEDIAGTLLGKNYKDLVFRFQKITKPYLVSFTAKPRGDEVFKALFFLKLMVDGESELDAGESANTFFNSNAEVIPPHRIQNMHHLENV